MNLDVLFIESRLLFIESRLLFVLAYLTLHFHSFQMRRIFYSSMVNMESVETQRKGMVVVFWAIGSNNSGARISASTYWKAARVQRCVPVKLVGFHFCYDTIFIRPIVSTIQLGVDFFSGIRLRSHFGEADEFKHESRYVAILKPCRYNFQAITVNVLLLYCRLVFQRT